MWYEGAKQAFNMFDLQDLHEKSNFPLENYFSE